MFQYCHRKHRIDALVAEWDEVHVGQEINRSRFIKVHRKGGEPSIYGAVPRSSVEHQPLKVAQIRLHLDL
ncbi:MAG: hypothetical protein ACLQU3_29420 [Limisphaerales bacterium]